MKNRTKVQGTDRIIFEDLVKTKFFTRFKDMPVPEKVKQFADTIVDVITATTTVSNTVTETTIFTSTVPANSLKVGGLIKIDCSGVISNDSAADDITIRVKIGSTTLQTFNPAIGNVTDEHWHVSYEFTVRSLGATGSIAEVGHCEIAGSEEDVHSIETIDTTSSNDITVTVQWDNAKAGNTISIYQGYRETKGAK